MSLWNYVATLQEPTVVTHACVGNFTSSTQQNLILAKCNRLLIHSFSPPDGLEPILNVPFFGRIAALSLFRPHGEAHDLLFIATEEYKFCVLQWDLANSEILTRKIGDVSESIRHRTDTSHAQIASAIIDPTCKLIGLHFYDGFFKVIPVDKNGHLEEEAYDIWLKVPKVLDTKFLFGCSKPTIAVLYQDVNDVPHVKTYQISLTDEHFVEGSLSRTKLQYGSHILIPVPAPLYGVLVIGEESIAYCSDNAFKAISIEPSIIKAYGRVDCNTYLLGDHTGLLHLLVITHDEDKVTGLEIKHLGETSIASTISYLDNEIAYIGSSYGDSQLIKLNLQYNAKRKTVEILERHPSLGPIMDFCVLGLEKQGLGEVVTCSGAYKDGSLRLFYKAISVNEDASVKIEGIKRIWSLKSSTDDQFDTFLVATFINHTLFFAMNSEDDLEQTKIDGFCSEAESLFCHDAVHNQLVQVTCSSVRLVSSATKELRDELSAPSDYSYSVATANATQILLATDGHKLVYLEIGDGSLKKRKEAQLEYSISCLDINPIGENSNCSHLAAVGLRTLTDQSIAIYSLPNLAEIQKVKLKVLPRSVLLCSFEGLSYLLCGQGDGHLLYFLLNASTGGLTDKKKVSLGEGPITLQAFSFEKTLHVLALSSYRAILIYGSGNELLFSRVHLKEVSHMCPYSSHAFPDRFAYAKNGDLAIGTLDYKRKYYIDRSIHLGEHVHKICHQAQTTTFAVLCSKSKLCSEDPEKHFVHLLDDQSFHLKSTYPLDTCEHGRAIISCSFSDDNDVYYCIGTAYVFPQQNEATKGRILVLAVKDGKFQLISEMQTKGAVYCLNAFSGKLLAGVDKNVQLYKWVIPENAANELQFECAYGGQILARYMQTRGDCIVVGDVMLSLNLLEYKREEGAIVVMPRNRQIGPLIGRQKYSKKVCWNSAVGILKENVYLSAEGAFNLFVYWAFNDSNGLYHLGDVINQFRHGSLVPPVPYCETDLIQTTLFGTTSGAIGVIALLPEEEYNLVRDLQSTLLKVTKSVGVLSHSEWRVFQCDIDQNPENEGLVNFLDGDIIESFLGLERSKKEEISKALNVCVEDLCIKVEKLTRLH